MRIAVTTNKNLDFRGGVENFTHRLVGILQERNHKANVFTWESIQQENPFPYSYLKHIIERTPYRGIVAAYLLALRVSKKKFDVVFDNDFFGMFIRSRRIAMNHGYYKDVFECIKHKISRWYYLWGLELAKVQKVSLNKADIIVTPSRRNTEYLEKNGFKVDYTIPHGIDSEFYKKIEKPRTYLTDLNLPENFLLYVGSKTPWKNFEMIKQIGKEYKVVCVANPDDDQNLIYRPNIKPESMPALYSAADIVLQPSFHEGFGYTVAEAMGCETPPVFTMTGYGLDIYEKIPEVIVQNPRNYSEIKQTIEPILDNRREIGKRCREFIKKNNNLEKWKKQWIEVFEQHA